MMTEILNLSVLMNLPLQLPHTTVASSYLHMTAYNTTLCMHKLIAHCVNDPIEGLILSPLQGSLIVGDKKK